MDWERKAFDSCVVTLIISFSGTIILMLLLMKYVFPAVLRWLLGG